ncbi:Sec-independent protein translocase protein TatB [Novilysobacter erysipheiresistens]|uniref:Sec-independent protein translocase protein TatB n=1 Tax=Novilysobacter erysipheiresistens TaxID=1749332 RepID=A0ABU7YYN3_9GAMM
MFDLGFSELFMVAIVALVVLGPERLPKAARFAGLWIRRARSQWQSVKSEFENELADEELAKSLRATRDELDDVRKRLKESGDSVRADFQLDPERSDSDSDHEETEMGSASDPELKAMMEPDDEPAVEPGEAGAEEPGPTEPGPTEPGPNEPGPEAPGPDAPERREPHPGEPPRREPGTPGPTKRDPEPDDPTTDPADPPTPDRPSRPSRP